MRPKLLLVMFVLSPLLLNAQNLVPNGDFESYNACPTNNGGIKYSANYSNFPTATDWVSTLQWTSPDYYNSCAPFPFGVPLNGTGYQPAHSGNGYAGIYLWNNEPAAGGNYREMVTCKLKQPLTAGKIYCVRFYASPGIAKAFSPNRAAIDEVGVHFSTTQPVPASPTVTTMPLAYHVQNQTGNLFMDTSLWYNVNGMYTATGGEEWMTIGTFGTAVPAYVPATNPIPPFPFYTYVFLDDVSVTEMKDTSLVHDTMVCRPFASDLVLKSTISSADKYLWNTGDTTYSAQVSDIGTYWCQATIDCNVFTDTFLLGAIPLRELDLGPDIRNCDSVYILEANYDYSKYSWSTGSEDKSIAITEPGTYILVVEDTCGSQSDTIAYIHEAPEPLIRDTVICVGVRNPVLAVGGQSVKWYTSIDAPTGSVKQPEINTDRPGKITLYVSQVLGVCESQRVPMEITIRGVPNTTKYDPVHLCKDKPATILIGKEQPEATYAWNTGETECCIVPKVTGWYYVTVSNNCGSVTDSIAVNFSDCNNCMMIPDAFTPNNDGRNDRYRMIFNCPVRGFVFSIYNRWGEMVYTSRDPAEGWDGTYKGAEAESGTYMFVVSYEHDITHRNYNAKGTVTLIR